MEIDKIEYLKRLPLILRRFSIKELEKIIFESYIKDWTWDQFLTHIQNTEENLNSTAAANFLCKKLKKSPPKYIADLAERIWLLDVCLHSKRQQWTTIDMKGGEGLNGIPLSADFADTVKTKLSNNSKTSLVRALRHQSHFWISVRLEKPSKKAASKKKSSVFHRYYVPTFFVVPFNRPIMFIMTIKERVDKAVLSAVAQAAGYRKASIRQLRDKHIDQLEKVFDMQQSFSEEAYTAMVAKEIEAVQIEKGVDFTSHSHKQEYLKNAAVEFPVLQSAMFLTSSPIKLEAEEGESSEWNKVEFDVQLTIKSKDVWETVQKLTLEENAFDFLPPKYMLKSLFSGKNINTIEDSSDEEV